MFKNIYFLALVPLCTFIGLQLYKSSAEVDKSKTIVMGTMSGWPPYVSMNELGNYEGFDIDVAQEIARRLNKKLLIKDMDTAYLIQALQQGSVDFIMTGLDITSERLAKMAMVPYQGEPITSLPLIFWKTIPTGVQKLEDLSSIPGAIVCVEPGSSQEPILESFKGFEIKRVDPLGSILEIQYGKALATLLEPALYQSLKKKYPELVSLVVPLSEKYKILGCGIGINKENTALISKIEAIIADLKKEGFLAQKEKQWFSKEVQ